jgi:DNA-binding MarR family transcriptional regulator
MEADAGTGDVASLAEAAAAGRRWTELVERLAICGQRLRRQLSERLDPCGLGDAELRLMLACERASESDHSQSELASQVGISAAQASALLEHLRRRGWIVCRRAVDDRRRQCWALTDDGRRQLETLLAALAAPASVLDRRLGIPQRCLMEHLLSRLAEALAAGVSPATPSATEVPHARRRAS